MPSAWRKVRVFLSSTFRDMHAERDHLVKVTFPALRERLLPYRVELYDIDLRWGITEDEAKSEKVIGLCLEQVDECRPFFLAFLGHRYGWVPDQVPADTQERFPLAKQHPGVSVTELEIRYGLARIAGTRALVLLRDEQAVASIPPGARRDFVEADAALQQKLAKLKQRLIAAEKTVAAMQPPLANGGLAVGSYTAAWDPTRYDRVTRTRGRLHGLDDFGRQVEDWLWTTIKTHLRLPDAPASVDLLEAEADLHERFLELRTWIYVGRDDLYRRLRDFALAGGEVPLLLTGPSGLGKSAALARFVRDFRRERPDAFVLPHFVGASPRTTSLPGMLQRLTQELQRRFNLTLPKAESPDEIIRTFNLALTSLPASARVVLVFDALNQLDADGRADSLVWLPERLPPNVRVLCSCATAPQQAPRVLTAFGARHFADVRLRPLNEAERRTIIRAVPRLVAKTLDERQIDALLANPATQNPLFLTVALEELRGYGSFERLNQMIAALPRNGDAVTKLFVQVFVRLEEEFNRPLVERALRLLACSRRGLSGPELVELTRDLGGQADDLYPVLRQLRPYLQVRDGLFDFYHLSIRRAVESRYLLWHAEEDQRDPWARWNPERQPPASPPTEPEKETRRRLIDFFAADFTWRSVEELPWQLAQLREWQRLFGVLGDLPFFAAAWEADPFEVRATWSLVKNAGGLEPIEAYRPALADPARQDPGALWRLAQYLEASGYGPAVLPLWSHFVDHFRRSGDDTRLASSLMSRAMILKATGDPDGATRLNGEAEAICRRLDDFAGLSRCLSVQAQIVGDAGELDAALRLFGEVDALCRRLNDPAGLATNLLNQGLARQRTGDPKGALRLFREAEPIFRRINDPTGLAALLRNQASVLSDGGDVDGAMRLLKEAEALCRRFNDPAGLEIQLSTQAVILLKVGDLQGAMRLLKEGEAICRRTRNPSRLASNLGNQAGVLHASGDRHGALRLMEEIETIYRRLNEPAGVATNLANRGMILYETGDRAGAMRLLKEAEAMCRRLNEPAGVAHSLGQQATILRDGGDLKGAVRLLKEAEAICRRLNNPAGLRNHLGNQAYILKALGDLDGARRVLKEVESLCRRLNDVAGLAHALNLQWEILSESGDPHGALALLRQQEALCRQLNDPAALATSLANQAFLLAGQLSRPAEALPLAEEGLDVATRHGLGALAQQIEPVVRQIRARLR